MSEKRDLKGSVVVITGASSGIGLATAKDLVAKGARVVLGARDVSSLSDFVASSGGLAVAGACDIRKPADCAALMDLSMSPETSFGITPNSLNALAWAVQPGVMSMATTRMMPTAWSEATIVSARSESIT